MSYSVQYELSQTGRKTSYHYVFLSWENIQSNMASPVWMEEQLLVFFSSTGSIKSSICCVSLFVRKPTSIFYWGGGGQKEFKFL